MYLIKTLLLFAICVQLISCRTKTSSEHLIHAGDTAATIYIDGYLHGGNWTITPELNPDVFPLEIASKEEKSILFKTDQDSITFSVKEGQSFSFIVLVNETDTAYTQFKSVPKKVNFDKSYIEQNRGKHSIEVLESQELFQVIAAITPIGLADTRSMIVNHDTTPYYLDVLEHFLPFQNEQVVLIIDSLLAKNLYINMKADACTLQFDQAGNLSKSNNYDRMTGASNLLGPYIDQLNEFSKKSDFRAFYSKHKTFYDSLVAEQERAVPVLDQWLWLESQFPDHQYDSYKITFSPLVKGNHSTVRFDENGFKQAIMFIRPPYQVRSVNENVSNGLITRIVFTEIDHNYVNPETDKYVKNVNETFADRDFWTNGKESKNYRSAYTIFNEYMTWSVYLLYCYDQYKSEDYQLIEDRIVNYKINRRGFVRFGDFHESVLNYFIGRDENETISDIYPIILKWASEYYIGESSE